MSGGNPYSIHSLRRSLPYFIFGKAGNGLLNFLCFLLVARVLPTTEYGYFIAAVASMELGLYVSSMGYEWPSLLLIPRFRRNGSRSELSKFIRRLALHQGMGHGVAALALLAGADLLAVALGTPELTSVLRMYGALIATEGFYRMVRDQFLGALLAQRSAQASQFVRNVGMLIFLCYAALDGGVWTAIEIAAAELAGSVLSLMAALLALRGALSYTEVETDQEREKSQLPSWGEARKMAHHGYISSLFTVAYGTQVLTLLVARFAGPAGAALFGFAKTLVEQLSRYMPAFMFLGMARPMVAARYDEHQSASLLVDDLTLFMKLNLLVVAPMVLFLSAFTESVMPLLASTDIRESRHIVAILVFWLVAHGFRRVIDTQAALVGLTILPLRCNIVLSASPLIAIWILTHGAPLQSVGALLVGTEFGYGALMLWSLQARELAHVPKWTPIIRFALSIPLIAGLLSFVPGGPPLWRVPVGAILSILCAISAMFLTKALGTEEIRRAAAFIATARGRAHNTRE